MFSAWISGDIISQIFFEKKIVKYILLEILYKLKSSNPLLLLDQLPKFWFGSITEIQSRQLSLLDGAGPARAESKTARVLGKVQGFQNHHFSRHFAVKPMPFERFG